MALLLRVRSLDILLVMDSVMALLLRRWNGFTRCFFGDSSSESELKLLLAQGLGLECDFGLGPRYPVLACCWLSSSVSEPKPLPLGHGLAPGRGLQCDFG